MRLFDLDLALCLVWRSDEGRPAIARTLVVGALGGHGDGARERGRLKGGVGHFVGGEVRQFLNGGREDVGDILRVGVDEAVGLEGDRCGWVLVNGFDGAREFG